MFQESLSAMNILCIETDKLKQANSVEFLDNFVMKEAKTKSFY